jgi:hypothetical protein
MVARLRREAGTGYVLNRNPQSLSLAQPWLECKLLAIAWSLVRRQKCTGSAHIPRRLCAP